MGLRRIEEEGEVELVIVEESDGNLRQEGRVGVTAEPNNKGFEEEHNKSLLVCILFLPHFNFLIIIPLKLPIISSLSF